MNQPVPTALQFLPHGPEFRFVHHITELQPGVSGTGEYQVSGSEEFLKGHFPGQPLFPGVLLIEAAAQMAGVVAQSDPAHTPLRNLKLTAIRAVKILGTASPGETIQISAQITGRMANLVQASAKVMVGEKMVMQGEITLAGEV